MPGERRRLLIAYEMAMLVKRAGPHLAARPRFPACEITVGLSPDGYRGQVG